jgi:hypothetical protein
MTTPYEQAFTLVAAASSEQFSGLSVGPAGIYERQASFLVTPSVKTDQRFKFNTPVSIVYEVDWGFQATAYHLYEQSLDLIATAGSEVYEQSLNLIANALPREIFEQYVSLIAGARTDFKGRTVSAGTSVFIDGVELKKTALDEGTTGYISLSGGRNGYFNEFEIIIPYNAFARSVSVGAPVDIVWRSYELTAGGDVAQVNSTMSLFLDSEPLENSSGGNTGGQRTVSLRCVSYSAGLNYLSGNRGAEPITTVWPAGTWASDILTEITPVQVPVTFDIVDFVLAQQVDAANRYPIDIITELFAAQGTVILSQDDGGILLTSDLPVPTASELQSVTPDHDLESDEFILSSSDAGTDLPVYNLITISDVALSDEVDLRAPEIVVDADDSTKATVYGYRVPWAANFYLTTSHDVCADAAVSTAEYEEVEKTESDVEFIDGEANFPYPISQLISVDWGCNNSLGTVTPSEDGKLSAATKENSLADSVVCKVKRLKFRITECNGHTVQLWNLSND